MIFYFKPTHKTGAHPDIKYICIKKTEDSRYSEVFCMTIYGEMNNYLTRGWTHKGILNAVKKGYWERIDEAEVALL